MILPGSRVHRSISRRLTQLKIWMNYVDSMWGTRCTFGDIMFGHLGDHESVFCCSKVQIEWSWLSWNWHEPDFEHLEVSNRPQIKKASRSLRSLDVVQILFENSFWGKNGTVDSESNFRSEFQAFWRLQDWEVNWPHRHVQLWSDWCIGGTGTPGHRF